MEPTGRASSSPNEAAGHPDRARLKRVRTGCLKCRVRRRKCDEGKPSCRRCTDGKFECRYPPGVKFLDKNVLTVDPAEQTSGSQHPRYARLKFLEPRSGRTTKTTGKHNGHPKDAAPDTVETPAESEGASQLESPSFENHHHGEVEQRQNYPCSPSSGRGNLGDSNTVSPLAWESPASMTTVEERLRDDAHQRTLLLTGAGQSEGFEIATHALLSLWGNYHSPPSAVLPQAGSGFPRARSHPLGATPDHPLHDNLLQQRTALTLYSDEELSEHHILDLLKHCRYDVAPWLDICDYTQAFGSGLLQFALTSDGGLEELLSLSSATCTGKPGPRNNPNRDGYVWSRLLSKPLPTNLFAATLRCVHAFITSPPESWQGPLGKMEGLRLSANGHLGQSLKRRLLCLLLRLEIAAALVAKTAPSAEGVALFELLSRSSMGEGLFEDACVPLRLCARVLGFCYGHPASQRATATQLPTPPRETWRELVEDLSSWYSNRPHPFQPMVEQEAQGANEEHDQLFPTILFTNGAAAFANQLYHTAMLLLLQHKPRTLALGPRRSAVMAPLWHAHRICGISLHNDRAGCWDPSLVASLYVAAKGMTYEPQHREILSALDRVAAATGWHIHRFQAMLQHAWGGDGS